MPPLPTLLDLVTVHGPWIIFLLALLETSFITGLLVPSGVATAIAIGIALEEGSSVLPVVAAALAGGVLGDNIGYWIGRAGRARWLDGSGRFARRVRDVHSRSIDYLSGRPFLSVSVARVVSFVRTIMPMATGMSGMPYVRFLPYDLLGLAMWISLYTAMGAGAGQGWMWVIRLIDLWVLAVAAVAAVVFFWLVVRRRSSAATRRSA